MTYAPEILLRLDRLVATRPDDIAFRFVDREGPGATLTYAQLHDHALLLSERIADAGAGNVVLVASTDPETVTAIYATWMAAGTCVTFPAPGPRGPDPVWKARLRQVALAADARLILSSAGTLPADVDLGLDRATHQVVRSSVLAGRGPAKSGLRGPRHGSYPAVAVLQFTSGSTARPKGVMVGFDNVAANLETIRTSMFRPLTGEAREQPVLSWMPLFHDMGLMSALTAVWMPTTVSFLRPQTVIMSPVRWLQAISATRAYVSPAPNFAFDLCVDRVPATEREGLDLSSWRVALSGAEAPRARTIRRFTEAYEPHGFRPEAWSPSYGMAEATLLVSGWASRDRPLIVGVDRATLVPGTRVRPADGPGTTEIVSSGAPSSGVQVEVRHPQTGAMLPDATLGRLVVQGPSVAHGYLADAAGASRLFPPAAAPGSGRIFETADLGFVMEGQVFVVGREDDALVVDGRNIYPDDLEAQISAADTGRDLGRIAAVATDEEEVHVVAELRRADDLSEARVGAVRSLVRRVVSEDFGVAVADVHLVEPGQVPRTTSGKTQHGRCRQLLQAGSLRVVGGP